MKLVFATNNPNKLKEIQAAVPASITILSLHDIGCYEDIPEDQDYIRRNSAQKVNFTSKPITATTVLLMIPAF